MQKSNVLEWLMRKLTVVLISIFSIFLQADHKPEEFSGSFKVEITEIDHGIHTGAAIYLAEDSDFFIRDGKCVDGGLNPYGFFKVFETTSYLALDNFFGSFYLSKDNKVSCGEFIDKLNSAKDDNPILIELNFDDKTIKLL